MPSSLTYITVDLVYAIKPREALVLSLQVPEGSTVAQVLDYSQLAKKYPSWKVEAPSMGIWGKPCLREDIVKNGDRVEVYRPLVVDPQVSRKQRAQKQQERKAAEKGKADKLQL